MSKVIKLLNSTYRLVRYLYPPQFRAMFADEMQAVFTLSLKENKTLLSLLVFVIWEGLTLPVSLITAHWHEYTRSSALVYQGEMMMVSPNTLRHFRWTIISSFALLALVALLVILPFFALGLHMQPTNLVLSGHFDPKGFSIYGGNANDGNVLHVLTILLMLIAPLVGLLLSAFSGLRLLKQWRKLNIKQRVMGGIALMSGASLLLFVLSPLGRIIYIWLLD